MGAHALLGASSSHRWLVCTPSARLEETLPEKQSDYADEGSLAHSIGELKLRKFIEPISPRSFNNRLKKFKEHTLYQDEMLKHTDTYCDYISGIVHGYGSAPYLAIEKKLNYSTYAPEGFGTGDCIIIGGNTLRVIDLKYGKGVPVSAVDNPQMKLYALGALSEYSILYAIETVTMSIVQPRLDSISEFTLTVDELLSWGESIKPIARQAYDGLGEYVAGEHCRFCRAKATCRARSEYYLTLEGFNKMLPPLISNEEVGKILGNAQELAAWVKALEEYALGECLKGNEIPGWKAVEGRSKRAFMDIDAAFKVLIDNGTEEIMLYKREPLTVAETEKLLGKPRFKELLTPYINMPPGKPTLAPTSDKREPIKRQSAAEIFNDEGRSENE